jgi:hypothetical protein
MTEKADEKKKSRDSGDFTGNVKALNGELISQRSP